MSRDQKINSNVKHVDANFPKITDVQKSVARDLWYDLTNRIEDLHLTQAEYKYLQQSLAAFGPFFRKNNTVRD